MKYARGHNPNSRVGLRQNAPSRPHGEAEARRIAASMLAGLRNQDILVLWPECEAYGRRLQEARTALGGRWGAADQVLQNCRMTRLDLDERIAEALTRDSFASAMAEAAAKAMGERPDWPDPSDVPSGDPLLETLLDGIWPPGRAVLRIEVEITRLVRARAEDELARGRTGPGGEAMTRARLLDKAFRLHTGWAAKMEERQDEIQRSTENALRARAFGRNADVQAGLARLEARTRALVGLELAREHEREGEAEETIEVREGDDLGAR